MKNTIRSISLISIVLLGLISACTPTPVASPPELTEPPVEIPPETIQTASPSPTPLPGTETIPLDTFADSIPWLPMVNTARPGSVYFLFNLNKPPFTNVLVREAFNAAIDRDALVQVAQAHGATDPIAATTLTPSATLGRDLYKRVGVAFHPSTARELLSQAGYTNLDTFPSITLMTNPGKDEINIRLAEEAIRMWQIHLGITVNLEVIKGSEYWELVASDPTEIFLSGWAADYNDPDGFLLVNFRTGSQYNYTKFSNLEFDELVDLASDTSDPATRQALYIQAEQILCEIEIPLIPIYHTTFNIP